MWPVILTTYNLTSWLFMKESYLMPTLLILGPKSLRKDIDVYLRLLIEELKVLWDKKGFETTNIVSGKKFNMRVMVLCIINDFPARSSLSGWSGQGYKACPTSNEDTSFVRVIGKTSYVGHERFLRKHINRGVHLNSMANPRTENHLENLAEMKSWLNFINCQRV